jgi:hypothetical protein
MNPDHQNDPSAQMSSFESELDIVNCQEIILKLLHFFQSLDLGVPRVRIVEDWEDHDGLEFCKGSHPLGFLFLLTSSPQTLFEGTPKDDDVYLRADAETGMWVLRFRTSWDDDSRSLVGKVQIRVHREICALFEHEMSSAIHCGDLRRVGKVGQSGTTDKHDTAPRVQKHH